MASPAALNGEGRPTSAISPRHVVTHARCAHSTTHCTRASRAICAQVQARHPLSLRLVQVLGLSILPPPAAVAPVTPAALGGVCRRRAFEGRRELLHRGLRPVARSMRGLGGCVPRFLDAQGRRDQPRTLLPLHHRGVRRDLLPDHAAALQDFSQGVDDLRPDRRRCTQTEAGRGRRGAAPGGRGGRFSRCSVQHRSSRQPNPIPTRRRRRRRRRRSRRAGADTGFQGRDTRAARLVPGRVARGPVRRSGRRDTPAVQGRRGQRNGLLHCRLRPEPNGMCRDG